MRATIKRKNLRRLASLSALGAGAMAVGAGTAEADIVKVDVDQELTLGINTGVPQGPITAALPGGAQLSIFTFASIDTGGHATRTSFAKRTRVFNTTRSRHLVVGGNGNIGFKAIPANTFRFFLEGPVFTGQTWNSRSGLGHTARSCIGNRCSVGVRFSRRQGVTQTFLKTTFNPVSRRYANASTGASRHNLFFANGGFGYLLFRFLDNGTPLYGWVQLGIVSGTGGGPDSFVFQDYAYNTTGATIAAGALPPVPEPSETVPLALSALVLGAAGIRRWRVAKTS